MNNISYFEAWKHWFDGETIGQMKLWGVSIFWWGRIGKLLQFLGGITIIAEIIGVTRLRKFGESLHRIVTMRKIKMQIKDSCYFIISMWKYFVSKKKDEERLMEESFKYKSSYLSLVVTLVLMACSIFSLPSDFSWGKKILILLMIFSLLVFFISPIIVLIVILFISFIGFWFDILLIEPFAKLIDNEKSDKLIKLLALILFLIGFQFDLLAS